jgi:hypothetical protein
MNTIGIAQQEARLAREWAQKSAGVAETANGAGLSGWLRALAGQRALDTAAAASRAEETADAAANNGRGRGWRESEGTAYWKERLVVTEEDGVRRMKTAEERQQTDDNTRQQERARRRKPTTAEEELIAAAFKPLKQGQALRALWEGVTEPEVAVEELEAYLRGKSACSSPGPSQLRYGHIKNGSWGLKKAVCMYATAVLSGQTEPDEAGGPEGPRRRARAGKWPKDALLSTLTYLRKKPGLAMKSYRPVTLQQTLTKIVTGILAARVAEACAQG